MEPTKTSWILLLCVVWTFSSAAAQVTVFPEEDLVVLPNSNFSFSCHLITITSGISVTGMEWLLNGTALGNLNLANVHSSFSEVIRLGFLNFVNVPLEYNNTSIQCVATISPPRSREESTSSATTLLVQGLVVLPLTQSRMFSHNVSLTCHTYGICNNITWIGPALLSDSHDRVIVTHYETQSELTITNLRVEDEGEYLCSCGESISSFSTLMVHKLPSLSVRTNQTFQRNETAVIFCHGDPGHPPHEIIWIYNDSRIVEDITQVHENSQLIEVLIIDNIQDSHAGKYTCGYNSTAGFIFAVISVRVISPPAVGFRFLLPHAQSVIFGDPLHLECEVEPDHPSFQYIWHTTDSEIQNRTLSLDADQVDIGVYRCAVYSTNLEPIAEHSILVRVINIPPLPENPEEVIIGRVFEDEQLIVHKSFKFALTLDNFSIEWEKISPGRAELVERVTYTFNNHTQMLIIHVNETWLTDDGTYRITLSNQYGSAVVMLRLHVERIKRAIVQLHFKEASCELIQEHRDTILEQLTREFSCTICGEVRILPGEFNCSFGNTRWLLTLLAQNSLPHLSDQITLIVDGVSITADISYVESGHSETSSLSPTIISKSNNIATIVAPISVIVVVASGIITSVFFIFWWLKCSRRTKLKENDDNKRFFSAQTSIVSTEASLVMAQNRLSSSSAVTLQSNFQENQAEFVGISTDANEELEKCHSLKLFDVLTELVEVIDEWRHLGLALGLPSSKVREIDTNNPNDVKKCLEEVIEAWLESDDDASWETLCTTLKTDLVDCGNIAKNIEEKFCVL